MYYRLAFHLGMTVREMLIRMDVEELKMWIAFSFLEPFGTAQEDERFGVLAAQQHNLHSSGAKLAPVDFFPPHTKQERNKLLQEKIDKIFSNMPQKVS